jgi:hypothetical protein
MSWTDVWVQESFEDRTVGVKDPLRSERRRRDLFEWQVDYGTFTIGISQAAATVRHILNQQGMMTRRPLRKNGRCFSNATDWSCTTTNFSRP